MKSAFTLLELVIVIAIVGVLTALAVPAYHHVRQGSTAAACLSNLRQLGVALNLYLGEHGMIMPSLQAARSSRSEEVPVIDNTLDRYASEPRIFACPADTQENLAATTGTSYYWNAALNGQSLSNLNFMALITDHSHIPILSDKGGFHAYSETKVNLLYADGHVTKELQFFTNQ